MKEGDKGLKGAERSRTPQEKMQNQLNWDQRGSQRQNHQTESMLGMSLDPLHLCDSNAAQSSCGTPNSGSGAVSDHVAHLGIFSP